MTRFRSFVEQLDTDNSKLSELEKRIEEFEIVWNEFEAVQSKIEIVDPTAEQIAEGEQFENIYFYSITKANNLLPHCSTLVTQPPSNANSSNQVEIRLPVISLPEFNGETDNSFL